MLPRNHPDRIQIAFDDHRLVANAGLILPATLALRLGLPQLLRKHLDLGGAPGRANTGDKMMTLAASALAGGDCIDDADVLRAGGTARVLGFTAKAPSTLGTFLRSFRWGHVRQLDRVSRELLARVWKAGAGPGDAPFTIDLDSTICETYGLAKEGTRHHGYTGARGYHPLLAVAAGLPRAKRIYVLTMLVEGSSMRSRVLRSPALLASSARIGPAGAVEASRTRRTGATRPKQGGYGLRWYPPVGVRGWKGLCGSLTEGCPASAGAFRRGIGRDRRSEAILGLSPWPSLCIESIAHEHRSFSRLRKNLRGNRRGQSGLK